MKDNNEMRMRRKLHAFESAPRKRPWPALHLDSFASSEDIGSSEEEADSD